MTPKDKAKDLVNKMHIENDVIFVMSKEQAKQCALIAVDEMLQNLDYPSPQYFFYLEVKKEIEKL